jgi:uncharacterized protein YecA (UPF0149 family)
LEETLGGKVETVNELTTPLPSYWDSLSDDSKKAYYDLKYYEEHYTYNSLKTLGRNDPCFCGSGKKLKKCCLDDFEKMRRKL